MLTEKDVIFKRATCKHTGRDIIQATTTIVLEGEEVNVSSLSWYYSDLLEDHGSKEAVSETLIREINKTLNRILQC